MTRHGRDVIRLDGRWQFQLDPDEVGVDKGWFRTSLTERVTLPGSTDENAKGERTDTKHVECLSRRYEYEGPAWYQRTVTVPETWGEKHVELVLERTRVTRVWVDDAEVGSDDSLCTPHRYVLTDSLSPGEHRLTVRVDNDADLFGWTGIELSHMTTKHTQTNWNGLLGRLELQATDPVWLMDVTVDPDPATESATVHIEIGNITGRSVKGTVALNASSTNTNDHHRISEREEVVLISAEGTTLELTYDLGSDALRWDEFEPAIYRLAVELHCPSGNEQYTDTVSEPFGLSDFDATSDGFIINGQTTFLRGKCDCCVFPNTGYAPMDVSAWCEVFETAQDYGINHYRFHSWCPPEAAFRAADELGVYLQPELPLWDPETVFESDDEWAYYRREAERILDAYGNHPSFVMFALGNELDGDRDRVSQLVRHCREYDPRRLYGQGSSNFLSDPQLVVGDYWTTWATGTLGDDNTLVRGSFPSHTRGHVNNKPPSTTTDYTEAIEAADRPVVGHEIGQYQAYPDFGTVEKYNGVLTPRNLKVYREHLNAHGMANMADDFHRSTGNLQVTCYREEVESALRTANFGGFQLLDLQDFPGQGTALVGILDPYLDSKGFITPERWREFCSPMVPLVRMDKRTWTTDEAFTATVEFANYGPESIEAATPRWTLEHGDQVVAEGSLPTQTVPQGDIHDLGSLEIDLTEIDAPATHTLVIRIEDEPAINRYDIWTYPSDMESTTPDGVTVAQSVEETKKYLDSGDDVLLLPELGDLQYSINGAFQPDFWCFSHFRRQGNPGTMGIHCDPDHPALASFPTDVHSDWQWWQLVKNSRPIVLDDMPGEYQLMDSNREHGYRPIVQVIDNAERNHKLGLLFEVSVDEGDILICSIDLPSLAEDPVARQLLHSLLQYVGSDKFDPREAIELALLKKLV